MKDYIFTQNREILQSILVQYQDIGVVVSENQTLDVVGAGLALYLSLQAFGKNVQIISKKQPIVEISNLVGVDKIKKSFDGMLNTLTVAIPRRGKAIQKVSYNIEGDWVNLNIIAGNEGLNFSEDEVRFIKKGASPTLVFAINVPRFSDLETLAQTDGSVRIVNIDNNPSNQMYGDVILFDPSFSSISEIVAKLIKELTLPVDIDIAQNLMDGVVSATSNFSSLGTDVYAFEAASFLMKSGAIRKSDYEGKIKERDKNQMNAVFSRQTSPLMNPQLGSQDASQIVGHDEENTSVPNDWFSPKIFKSSKQDQQ